MLLAVDIGNSRIKFGVYDGEVLTQTFSAPTDRSTDVSLDEARPITTAIDAAIICSVVPAATDHISKDIGERFAIEPVIVTNDFDFGLTILHTPLASIGTDRLVNCFGAVQKYSAPCIVCSIGTALTIDYVDADHVMRGGLIAPGMQMLANSLHSETAQLPRVEIEKPDELLQRTTIGALQSGVVNGFIGLFDSLISNLKSEIAADAQVIATGGTARFIAAHTDAIDVVDETLLLDGLQRLHSKQS